MRTQISESVFPRKLDEPNRISSTYTTLTLFPHPGPLDSNVQEKTIVDILRDYMETSGTIMDLIDYRKRYNDSITIPQPLPEFLNPDIPYLGNIHKKTKQDLFRERLTNFASSRILTSSSLVASESSITKGLGYTKLNKNFGVLSRENTETTDLLFMKDGSFRLLPNEDSPFPSSRKVSPFSPMYRMMKKYDTAEMIEPTEINGASFAKPLYDKKKQFDKESIFHRLARRSPAIDNLIDAGVIGVEGRLLQKRIASRNHAQHQILSYAIEYLPSPDHKQIKIASQMLERIAKRPGNNDLNKLLADDDTRNQLSRYVGGVIAKSPLGKLKGQGTPVYQNDREWAFQRTERVDLHLGTPVFRGPVSASSVAPGSTLKNSEQITRTSTRLETIESKARSMTINGKSQEISSLMTESLNHLTESGIQSEEAFQQKSTLLNTLSERRRSIVNTVINQVSASNKKQSFTRTATESVSSSSYETQGMDKNRSTTELSFQIVSPINVKIRIEKVGLVWCPYIISPFIGLRNLISRYESQAEAEYLQQNRIVDPVEPVKVYNTVTFQKEIEASGRHEEQRYDFNFTIPADQTGYKLNRVGCSVDYRNGTGKDYDWKERGNWDNLENWAEDFTALEQTGNRIHGTVVLATTDPEYWNKGFLTLTFELKQLTEQSKTAQERYNRDNEETKNRRDAIEVQARQYARMRRNELIEKYTNEYDMHETLFAGLVRRVFSSHSSEKQSYFKGVLRSCIDWTTASMQHTHGSPAGIPYPEYPTDHFMNTPGVRFTLPLHRQSEEAFFGIIDDSANNYYVESAKKVKDSVNNYRDSIEEMKTNNPDELEVDSYSSEMVLGNHLEAVLSNTTFTEEEDV